MDSSEAPAPSISAVRTPETVAEPSSEEPAHETVPQPSFGEPADGSSSGSCPIDLSTKKNTESISSASQGKFMKMKKMLFFFFN